MTKLRPILSHARRSELLGVTAILCLGIGVLFWQVILQGDVLVPGDIPVHYDPVMAEAIPELVRPQNPLLSDLIHQNQVWHTLAGDSMQSTGKIPLWNPYMLAGQPLVGNAQPSLFYPPNQLLRWFDAGLVTSIRAMFNMLLAGLFTYLFGRALRLSKLAATLSAIVYAFSGAIVLGTGYAHITVLAWLPMALWAGEKMLTGSRPYFWALMTGIGVAIAVIGGHPESTFHNYLVIGLYMIARLFQIDSSRRDKVRLFALFMMSVAVGALLSAVQWLPFVGWLSVSGTQSRGVGWDAESILYSSEWLRNLPLLATLAFPNFFGHPADGTYFWPFDNVQNYLEQAIYFGLIPLALAVGAVFSSRRRKVVLLLALLAFVFMAVSMRFPGFELVNHLPIFEKVNHSRLTWYVTFFGAMLAGFGLDSFSAYLSSRRAGSKGVIYGMAAVFSLASLAVLAVIFGKYGLASLIEMKQNSITYYFLFTIFSFRQIRTTITIVVLAAAIGLLIYAIWIRRPVSVAVVPYLFVALTFVELIVVAYGYNTMMPSEQVLPPVRLTETLKQDESVFRIMGERPAFWPNYGATYGLFHVGGDDIPVHGRYAALYKAQGGTGHRQAWSAEWPLVDWMNVKYVISPQERQLDKLELVYEDGYYVYVNNDVLPRAYMVYDVQVVSDDEEMLATLTGGEFDFGRTVLLEENLPEHQGATIMPSLDEMTDPPQPARFVEFSNEFVALEVETESPGLLLMSDVLSPGWKATVDGEAAQLLRANYAFRAVYLPAGDHQVTFTYEPLDYQIGLVLSGIALLALGIGLPVAWFARRKATAQEVAPDANTLSD